MNHQKGNLSVIVAFIIVIGIIGSIIYILLRKPDSTGTLADAVKTAQVEKDKPVAESTTKQDSTTNKNMDTNTKETLSAKNGDTLVMNYTGRLTNGTVFDSNIDPKFKHVQPFEFKLGAGQVIAGWDEGLLGMKIGEKKTLTIPPEKGYGAGGQGPIPPNSTLIFDVELVGIK